MQYDELKDGSRNILKMKMLAEVKTEYKLRKQLWYRSV
jgi:hypothetical protein